MESVFCGWQKKSNNLHQKVANKFLFLIFCLGFVFFNNGVACLAGEISATHWGWMANANRSNGVLCVDPSKLLSWHPSLDQSTEWLLLHVETGLPINSLNTPSHNCPFTFTLTDWLCWSLQSGSGACSIHSLPLNTESVNGHFYKAENGKRVWTLLTLDGFGN